LIIGSGTALVRGGPLGLFLGYSFVGAVCYMVMIALGTCSSQFFVKKQSCSTSLFWTGEMAAYLPHKKGFAGYSTRFVDPALGFALGWNYLFKWGFPNIPY